VKEAVTTAHMAREVFGTPWIKLEVIGEDDTLQPDVFGLTEAARLLCAEGVEVFPYTTEDLVVAERLLAAGCRVLMPWGAPIGSGRGLNNLFGLTALRAHFPDVPLIIDAGIGVPSHAARALELGFDAVLINTAIARRVARFRRGSDHPRHRAGARPGADGGSLCPGGRSGTGGTSGRTDRAARPRRTLDPRDRHGLPRMNLARVYTTVDSAPWVKRLAPLGVRLVQLRIKEQPDETLLREIRAAR